MPSSSANAPRRTLLLTGASRGIGHATVIRFSSAGWRVITCSRHAFPEVCPWGAGPEDHIEVDLADHADTTRAISEIRKATGVAAATVSDVTGTCFDISISTNHYRLHWHD